LRRGGQERWNGKGKLERGEASKKKSQRELIGRTKISRGRFGVGGWTKKARDEYAKKKTCITRSLTQTSFDAVKVNGNPGKGLENDGESGRGGGGGTEG